MTKTKQVVDAANQIVTLDRRSSERRTEASPVAAAAGTSEPRRKKQRRRQIDPTTCERDYSGDEIEFMQAMDAYKRAAGRMFPTCSEILEVIRSLGYVRLTAEQLALVQVTDLQAELNSLDYEVSEDEFGDDDEDDDEDR